MRNAQTQVVVIGAGVIGASIAYHLAEAGALVTVVEALPGPGLGTSSASFAWINASAKSPYDYYALNAAGVVEHRRLAETFGEAPWLHTGGNLVWPDTEALRAFRDRVSELEQWGYCVQWLKPQEAAEREPALRGLEAAPGLAFYPEEAWVDVPLLVHALLERAQACGARLHCGDPVKQIQQKQGQVVGVVTASGITFPALAVVNAAGPAAAQVAELAGLPLPLQREPGLVVRVAAPECQLRHVVHTPIVNVRPDGSGFLLVHHESIDDELGEARIVSPDDPRCAALLSRARDVLAGLEEARVVAARVGVRPIPSDGRTCAGAVTALPGYYEAVTHSGVTLGPLIGRLLAREILSGERDPLLAPFSPDRFPR